VRRRRGGGAAAVAAAVAADRAAAHPGAMPGPTANRLPRAVYALGAVSLLTDVASELIVPLLPLLLAQVGGTMVHLGLLQGISEGAVSLLKLASGWLSDRTRRRKPWMVAGYGLSALLRPLFALAGTPLAMTLVRAGDRVGKGLRSAPRDALLADLAGADQRGAAFGVQRAMDHAGALLGALLAAALLAAGVELRVVFALALLPGLLGVFVLVRFVPEHERAGAATRAQDPPDARRKLLPLLWVVAPSAVAASVDLLALMRARELGVADAALPLLWAALHVVRAGLAAPLGRLSDRFGRRRMLAIGLLLHALVLVAFADVQHAAWLWPAFLGLGLHAGCTEGAERGLVAELSGGHKRGTAFGLYHAVQGLAAFAGPIALGALWQQHGAAAAFHSAAGAAVVALVALGIVGRRR
jgi:MFS family permease